MHDRSGRLATVTVVRPTLQFGVVELGGDGRVEGFEEKPRLDRWINGGFFRFEPGALDYIEEDSVLEQAPLERLASDGQLGAYRHEGFWDCMDTYKDAVLLNDLWEAGDPPWKVWAGDLSVERRRPRYGRARLRGLLARELVGRRRRPRRLAEPRQRPALGPGPPGDRR